MGTKFILGQEDGTVAGGNTRGANSVDLQMSRTNVNQVALANNSFIGGGANNSVNIGYGANEGGVIVGGTSNTVGANFGFIGGGSGNYLGGSDNFQVIVGGASNSISQSGGSFIGGGTANSINTSQGTGYCVISGGRSNSITSTSAYSTISGGQSNTASTGSHATVVGGSTNTSSGVYSVSGGFNNVASGGEASVALGINNTASGYRSVAMGAICTASGLNATCFGRQNQATGNYSFIGGGEANQATAAYSVAFGLHALAGQFGAITNANGIFQYKGDAQVVNLLARKQDSLTTGATTKLSLDGTGTTNLIDFGLSGSTAISFLVTIKWSAGINNANGAAGISNDDCITQTDQIMMKKLRYGALSLVGTTSTLVTKGDASMTTSAMNYSVSGLSELVLNYQAPTFASGGPITVRVLASIEVVSLTTAPF